MRGKTNLKSIPQNIGKNGHQLAQNRPDATLAHNSVIFHPILMITKLYFLHSSDFSFCPIFALRPHMGNIARMDPKPLSKLRDVSCPSPTTH